MTQVRWTLGAALIGMLLAGGAAAQAQGEPGALIHSIYQEYIKAGPAGTKTPDQYTRAWYSKAIRAKMDALTRACRKSQDICGPDSDFLVDGQDFDIKTVAVKELARAGGKATVEAKFLNGTDPRTMVFTMVQEGGRWVIDEMIGTSKENPKGYRLSQILKP